MNTKILIVDDDIELAAEMRRFLSEQKYEVQTAGSVAQGQIQLKEFQPDFVLLDLKLPDGSGLELLEHIRESFPEISVLMLSGYGHIPDAVAAIRLGAEDFLTKPVEPDHLMLKLQKLTERRQLCNRLQILELDWESQRQLVIGQSRPMQELIQQCQAVAGGNSTVLISGETGTGKHLIAHYIHQNSPRRQEPFVYVNCATLSEQLLESDLFGHEKGAFTGAVQQKKGRVELAHRGTLFLDEIGELPAILQAKLLHFIEYGEFQRVGGTATLRSDARIICATNRDLPREVAAGRFREDLFYRINVIRLTIPPLRERPADIPELLYFFLEKFRREMGKPVREFSESALRKLQKYPWPGNVRELRNAVERAVALCQADQLTEKDFPFLKEPAVSPAEESLFAPAPLQNAVNRFKKEYLARILAQTGGNQSRAAKMLKIQRTYLNRLLKELKVNQQEGKGA